MNRGRSTAYESQTTLARFLPKSQGLLGQYNTDIIERVLVSMERAIVIKYVDHVRSRWITVRPAIASTAACEEVVAMRGAVPDSIDLIARRVTIQAAIGIVKRRVAAR